MIRFACPSCGLSVSAPEDCAGRRTKCRRCHKPIVVPFIATIPRTEHLATKRQSRPRRAAEMATHLISLMLGFGILGLVGWLIVILPNPRAEPGGRRGRVLEQLESLAQVNPLPLLQPEVETPIRVVPVPLPSRVPLPPLNAPAPTVNRPASPPPVVEGRRSTLPPPARPATDSPKRNPPPSSTTQEEADSLGARLVKSSPEQQDILLKKLSEAKGPEYTWALATAIGQLSGEAKNKARQTLADRLTRFTAKTLLAYLGSDNPELRGAAALAFGMKDDKDHISELIDLLEDPEPSVVRAAHIALKRLTRQDPLPGPSTSSKEHAETRPARTPATGDQNSPSPRPIQPVKVAPPATDSQAPQSREQKRDDDVPEVALVPPEETSPAVKAIIQANALALSSKKAADRIQAARVLGGLGEAGKPARRYLCAAMLDPVIAVRVAAADALKDIDPKMHYLAVLLASEKVASESDALRIASLLVRVQRLREDGEPLAPLVAYTAKFAASNDSHSLLITALTTLSHIGRKDLSSYRVVASALTNRDPGVRAVALRGLARMKHGKLAVPRILVLLGKDFPAIRIAAIETLAALADESTEEIIADAIASQRYHDEKEVRRAVESALNKLENKQRP